MGAQVLPAYGGQKEAACRGRIEVEQTDWGGCADHVAGSGELRCASGDIASANKT